MRVVGSLVAFGLLAISGCGATSSPVKGPDGEPAHVISCGKASECYEKASTVCDGGYVIRESHGIVPPGYDGVPIGDRVEILVSCKADMATPESSSASSASDDRDDSRVCQAASKFLGDFGAYWAAKGHGKLLDELPPSRDFVVTCQAMPENVQRCMHDKYRTAHEQSCTALLVRLDPAAKNKIDSLFLQVPSEQKPAPSPPGEKL